MPKAAQMMSKRRLKPRLHKRSPPPRTEDNNVILINRAVFNPLPLRECLYRRGF